MATFNPRNRNIRVNEQTAPHSWSQRFYDSRRKTIEETACGFWMPTPDDNDHEDPR